MATSFNVIIKQIESLYMAIGRADIKKNSEKNDHNDSFVISTSVNQAKETLKIFKLSQSNIIFNWNYDSLQVFVELYGEKTMISLEDVEGIPDECITNREKMRAFLNNSTLSIPKYLNENKFSIRLNLPGLKGGGNIGTGINYWPLNAEGNKFVIPYRIDFSSTAVFEYANGNRSAHIKTFINKLTKTGKDKEFFEEVKIIKVIIEAVRLWNDTGLVELVPFSNQGNLSAHRIKLTTNRGDYCESNCGKKGIGGIGMCNPGLEQAVSCDLEGKFHTNPLQSILHEIGHVIGLRHEHVREDRDAYIDTDFIEDNACQKIGTYNLRSVMHYEIGDYANDKGQHENHLYLKDEPFNFILQNCPSATNLVLKEKAELENIVGKSPIISDGDREAVSELVRLAQVKEAEAEERARKKAEAESKTRERELKRLMEEFQKIQNSTSSQPNRSLNKFLSNKSKPANSFSYSDSYPLESRRNISFSNHEENVYDELTFDELNLSENLQLQSDYTLHNNNSYQSSPLIFTNRTGNNNLNIGASSLRSYNDLSSRNNREEDAFNNSTRILRNTQRGGWAPK